MTDRPTSDRRTAAPSDSEARYRALTEAAFELIAIWSGDRLLAINPAGARMLGYAAPIDVVGQPLPIVPAGDAAGDLGERLRALLGGVPMDAPLRQHCRRPDGSICVIEFGAAVVPLGEQRAVQLVGRDVTPLDASAETLRRALEESEQRYRSMVEGSPLGIVVHAEGRVVYANPAAVALVGAHSAEQLMQRPVEQWFAPDQWLAVRERLQRLARGEPVQYPAVVNYRRMDGSEFPVETVGSIIRWHGKSAIQVLGHDITARVEAEQAVARLNHELERRVELRTAELAAANRELETFSYSVSHDLRAPLRHMTGFAAVLRERLGDAADAEALHCLDRITAAADRMSMLIDGLLQLSRTTRTPLATRDVDLQQLVAEVRRDCAAKAAADVVWDIGVLPAVSADRTLLRVVLTNLLENACKFTARRRPARIAVDAEAAHGWVRVHVRDNGVGFDPSYADKLFGMFQRLHPTHEFEGDGIGLATVRRIVERHGGEVGALGSVDGGATFWFTLPGVR